MPCICCCLQVEPVPSLLRGFSAPVKLVVEGQSDEHLKLMFAHDSDEFNRWSAMQRLWVGKRGLFRAVQRHTCSFVAVWLAGLHALYMPFVWASVQLLQHVAAHVCFN